MLYGRPRDWASSAPSRLDYSISTRSPPRPRYTDARRCIPPAPFFDPDIPLATPACWSTAQPPTHPLSALAIPCVVNPLVERPLAILFIIIFLLSQDISDTHNCTIFNPLHFPFRPHILIASSHHIILSYRICMQDLRLTSRHTRAASAFSSCSAL